MITITEDKMHTALTSERSIINQKIEGNSVYLITRSYITQCSYCLKLRKKEYLLLCLC